MCAHEGSSVLVYHRMEVVGCSLNESVNLDVNSPSWMRVTKRLNTDWLGVKFRSNEIKY